MTHLRAQKKISAKNIYLHFIVRYTNKPQPIVRVLIQCCKSMHSQGNVAFSGFKNTHWLRYSISKDTVYCPSCVVFGSKASRDNFFLSTQVNDWSNIHNYIKRHEVLNYHTANQQAATHFLDDQSKTSET